MTADEDGHLYLMHRGGIFKLLPREGVPPYALCWVALSEHRIR